MTNEEFRGRLEVLGFNQSEFAQRMVELGDPRPFKAVLRRVNGYATGERKVPGELAVVLTLLAVLPGERGAPTGRGAGRPRTARPAEGR